MIVKCGVCHQKYDADAKWTQCPHESIYFHGQSPFVEFKAVNAPWPSWPEQPKIPDSVFELYREVNAAFDKLTGAELLWPTEFKINPFMPKNAVWMVDSKGTIYKIVNIANALHELDGISLCTGEMK